MYAKVKRVLDRSLELLATISMVVLVLDVVWQVFTRFILKHPSSWTEELATFLMIWVGMLGASVALNRGAHLGIDYFVSKLPPQKAIYTVLFAFFSVAVFSILVLIVGGTNLVRITIQTGQVSAALGLKMGYVYLALPISGFFLALYSIELFIETLLAIKRGQFVQPGRDLESSSELD